MADLLTEQPGTLGCGQLLTIKDSLENAYRFGRYFWSLISRAVVYHNYLEIAVGLPEYTFNRRSQILHSIETRNDDGNDWSHMSDAFKCPLWMNSLHPLISLS